MLIRGWQYSIDVRGSIESVAGYAGFIAIAIEWSALLIYYLNMPLYFGRILESQLIFTLEVGSWLVLQFWTIGFRSISEADT